MIESIHNTVVLCDLDAALLTSDGAPAAVSRDVVRLFTARGGRFAVYSSRTPESVRAALGGLALTAPSLLCGGTLLYGPAEGQLSPLYHAPAEQLVAPLTLLLAQCPELGIVLQMADGTTRSTRMNHAAGQTLRYERVRYTLLQTEDLTGEVLRAVIYAGTKTAAVMATMQKLLIDHFLHWQLERLSNESFALLPAGMTRMQSMRSLCAVCGVDAHAITVMAGSTPMLDFEKLAGWSAASASAPPEVRVAAREVTASTSADGAAAEFLYGLVRQYETEQ